MIFDFDLKVSLTDRKRTEAERFHFSELHLPTRGFDNLLPKGITAHIYEVFPQKEKGNPPHFAHDGLHGVCSAGWLPFLSSTYWWKNIHFINGLDNRIHCFFQEIRVAPVDYKFHVLLKTVF